MSLERKDIKDLHDKAYTHNQITRERAADDLVFYWVTQWDDNLLNESQLKYRGEFNILRKAGRQIISDLRSNPVQVDFQPKDDDREDGADLLDGLYRSDDRNNTSMEAYDNGMQEAVVAGYGAWVLETEYVSNRAGNENQMIKRRPIMEANNTVFWDPNAKLMDKSDARYVSVLTAYSEDGYMELVKELTGEEIDSVNASSFSNPEESYVFPWAGGENKWIYVVEFYHVDKVKDKALTLTSPFGDPIVLLESSLDAVMDDMIDAGYEIESERVIERNEVTKYIASGEEILSEDIIPGENIPVIPVYGERAWVEDEEHYEGVTRLAKDPQRLRNFQMSYLADIVSRSPRQKPIFSAEQVQGYEFMYEEAGVDNNYPYVLQNLKDANGEPLPPGPLQVLPETPIPQALAASIDLSRQAVEDVANPGIPQDIADPDLSGKAVIALQNRMDHQSMVYQQNVKHAKRRDGEVYASMASVVYDTPRKVMTTMPDGSRKSVKMMETIIDDETGMPVTLNDLTNMEFEVFADVGPSYTSKKEQMIEQLTTMMQTTQDPALANILSLSIVSMMDGVDTENIRKYAKNQLILQGIVEPETDEEIALLQQAQQSQQQQQDPAALIGQAEMLKAQSDLMKAEQQAIKTQSDIEIDQAKVQISAYDSETKRGAVKVNAEKAGLDAQIKMADLISQQAIQEGAGNVESMSFEELSSIAQGQ